MLPVDLDSRIQQVSGALATSENALLPKIDKALAEPIPLPVVRYRFTLLVLCSFLFGLGVTVAFLIFGGAIDRTNILIDVLKTLMLPLVTLMIGHYFGSSQKD